MSTIKIEVTGTTGTGKTAICQIISEVLKSRGIQVTSMPPELSDTTHFSELRNVVELEGALRSLAAKGLTVEISETNAYRARHEQS